MGKFGGITDSASAPKRTWKLAFVRMELEFPKSQLRRLVKDSLNNAPETCKDATGTLPERLKRMQELHVNKDTMQAFSESTKIFIHYVTYLANEFTRESKRLTVSGEDVLKALEHVGLKEMEPLFLEKLERTCIHPRGKNGVRIVEHHTDANGVSTEWRNERAGKHADKNDATGMDEGKEQDPGAAMHDGDNPADDTADAMRDE